MALVPDNIAASLNETSNGLGEIFTNVQDVVQTVGSIYDQIRGKDEGLAAPPVAAPAPTPAPVQAAPSMSTQTKYVLLGLGVVVVILALGMRR